MAPARVFLTSQWVWGLLFYMMVTVSMIYQVEIAGLTPLELVLVGTAMEVSAFIFEVPTGLLADGYSRKWSVVLGYLLIGVSFVVAASFPVFWVIALGAALFGLGWTFVSGALQAWIADETSVTEAARLYVRGEKLGNYGAFAGILVAMLLGSLQVSLPYLLSGVLFILWGLAAAWLMSEDGFTPHTPGEGEGISHFANLRAGISVVRGSSTLVLLMIVGVVIGTFSEGYDRLNVAHLLRGFSFPAPWGLQPVVLFGLFAMAGNLLTIALLSQVEQRVDLRQVRQVALSLAAFNGLILVAVIVFALSGWVWLAIAMTIVIAPLRRAGTPLITGWLNQHVASRVRATVISLHSQSDALGQMAGGPAVGVFASVSGIRPALVVSGMLLTPAVWLFYRSRRHQAGPLGVKASE